jgi:hypothetical protein
LDAFRALVGKPVEQKMGIDFQCSFFVPDFQVGVIDARYVALVHHIALQYNGAQIDARLHQYRHWFQRTPEKARHDS